MTPAFVAALEKATQAEARLADDLADLDTVGLSDLADRLAEHVESIR